MNLTLQHLFTPHPTNNHRARILHPAGLSVLLGIFILSQSLLQLWKSIPNLPDGLVLGYASNITALQVVELTNVERSKQGLPPLSYDTTLSEAAAGKAADMFAKNYWAHIAPDGTTPWTFIRGAGYRYSVAGENLARDFDSTDAMLSAWMTSPTHRENIVHSKYKDIGVAVVNGTLDGVETTLVVQMFGTSTSSVAAVGSIPTETREAVNSGVKELQSEQQAGPPAPLEAINPEEPSEPVQEQPSPPYDTRELARVLHYDQSLGVTLANQTENNSYLSPLLVTKAISTSIIMLVMAVLVYDSAVLHRRKIPRVVGKNWAHLIFFSLVVMLIVTMAEGVVL